MKTRLFIIIIIAAAALQGCVFAVDSGPDDPRSSRQRSEQFTGTPTIGQELLDLDRARAAGAITRAEYDRLKASIIENAER